MFGGLQTKDNEQAELLATRLRKRARHLRRWPTKRDITCFRLYERDIPEIPLVIDRYDDHIHVVEFERPHERDLGRHAAWLELMKKSIAKSLDTPIQRVHLKSRLRQRRDRQHRKLNQRGKRLTVGEGGLQFLVNLEDYIDTGLFLDHRLTRSMVRDEVKGKRFLNLFAYTGSFSVYAADGAAASTCTVDWSNTYLDWARENMAVNHFTGPEHRFVNQGAVEFVDRQIIENLHSDAFDVAVVDPPTFSNSKRTDRIWDIQRDHARLLNQLRRLMSPGGNRLLLNQFSQV